MKMSEPRVLSQIQKYQNKVEKFSTRLREILDGLRVVASKYSSDDNTLFLDWYEDKLASLSNHIRNTIENESFYFDASLIQEIDKIYDKVFQGIFKSAFHKTVLLELDWTLCDKKSMR